MNPPNVNASSYPGADACAKIQAAIDAFVAFGGGSVVADFPPGTYVSAGGFIVKPNVRVTLGAAQRYIVGSKVQIQENGHLVGFGTSPVGGSIIQAANGLNQDVVLFQNSAGPAVGIMWAELAQIRIEGNGANQTAGNGLTINQLDDTNSIHDILIKSAWGWGTHFVGLNSGGSVVDNISIFSSFHGGAMFFDGTESGLAIGRVHAGGNISPAIYCKSALGGTTLAFQSFQLEGSGIPGAGTPAIVSDGSVSNTRLHFDLFSASSVVGGTDFIQHLAAGASTSTPAITMDDVNLGNNTQYPTFYRDLHNSYSIPTSILTANGHVMRFKLEPSLRPYSVWMP
jgi:hypothetical protein